MRAFSIHKRCPPRLFVSFLWVKFFLTMMWRGEEQIRYWKANLMHGWGDFNAPLLVYYLGFPFFFSGKAHGIQGWRVVCLFVLIPGNSVYFFFPPLENLKMQLILTFPGKLNMEAFHGGPSPHWRCWASAEKQYHPVSEVLASNFGLYQENYS